MVTGRRSGPKRVGRAADVPAQGAGRDPGEHHPRAPYLAKNAVETVKAPDREQVRDAATAHPDHILVQEELCHVLDARHREQVQVHDIHTGHVPSLVPQSVPEPLVAAGRSHVAQPWASGMHPGQLDGMKDQRGEREISTRPSLQSSGGRKDRRQIGRHAEIVTGRWRRGR